MNITVTKVRQYESIETSAGPMEYIDSMENLYGDTADIYAGSGAAVIVYDYAGEIVSRSYRNYWEAVNIADRRGFIF